MKIEIVKNPNGDTRTAPENVTYEQFQKANDMHRKDVSSVMRMLSDMCWNAGENHDFTKKTRELDFYDDFLETRLHGADFTKGDWHKMHVAAERHHLSRNCPEDVNLIDVLEMIADCTCAGLARSGEVRGIELSDDILHRAVENTINLILNNVEVVDVPTKTLTEVAYK